jgi:hypothetical protein
MNGLFIRATEKFSDWALPRGKIVPKRAIVPNPPATYRDLSLRDYREDALDRVAKEAEFIDVLHADLLEHCASEASLVKKTVQQLRYFAQTGTPTREGIQKMRMLYFKSCGVSNKLIKNYLSAVFPKPDLPTTVSSILGEFSQGDIREMVQGLARDGVYRLPQTLSREYISEITENLREQTSNCEGLVARNESFVGYRESALLQCGPLKRLASDALFYHVAGEYLNVQPVLAMLYAWNTFPHANGKEVLSHNAQLFHVDMSHPSFLKVFIYLNDVGEKNGPHCLIPGTHLKKDKALWRDVRLSDDEVASHYPRSSWAYQMGAAGSIFLVDTRTLHKGEPLVEGERRICQLYYTNTLFGDPQPAPGTAGFDPKDFGDNTLDLTPRFFERYSLNL